MRKLEITKILISLAVVASSFGANAEPQKQGNTLIFEAPKITPYAVPDNSSYGVLKKIIEIQGHELLKLEKWSPGNNDLTPEQIRKIDFSKLDFSTFIVSANPAVTEHLSDIPIQEQIRQTTRQKNEWDNLVRSSAASGAITPISNILLSHDDINAQIFSSAYAWSKKPTEVNRARHIQALGLLAARHSDITSAKAENIYVGSIEASNEFTEYSKVTKCYYKGKMSVIINEAYFLQENAGRLNCNGLSTKQMSSLDWSKLNLDPIFPITTESWKQAQ